MKINSHTRLYNICVTNQTNMMARMVNFYSKLKIGWSHDIKRLYLTFK